MRGRSASRQPHGRQRLAASGEEGGSKKVIEEGDGLYKAGSGSSTDKASGNITVTEAGTREIRRRESIGKEQKHSRVNEDFLRNEPLPGAVTRDVIGTISNTVSRGVTPRDTPAKSSPNC